jgi:hypothetical protein
VLLFLKTCSVGGVGIVREAETGLDGSMLRGHPGIEALNPPETVLCWACLTLLGLTTSRWPASIDDDKVHDDGEANWKMCWKIILYNDRHCGVIQLTFLFLLFAANGLELFAELPSCASRKPVFIDPSI